MIYFDLVDGQNVSRINFFGNKFLCVGNGSINISGNHAALSHAIAIKTLSFGLTSKKTKITRISFKPSFSVLMENGDHTYLNILLGHNSGLFDFYFKSNFCSVYIGDDLNGFLRSDNAAYLPRIEYLNTYPNQIPFNLQSSLFPHNENYDLDFYSTKKNTYLNFSINLDFSLLDHITSYNFIKEHLGNVTNGGFDYDAGHLPLPRYYHTPYITAALFYEFQYEVIIQGEIIEENRKSDIMDKSVLYELD